MWREWLNYDEHDDTKNGMWTMEHVIMADWLVEGNHFVLFETRDEVWDKTNLSSGSLPEINILVVWILCALSDSDDFKMVIWWGMPD
jgi:hypothetical protein